MKKVVKEKPSKSQILDASEYFNGSEPNILDFSSMSLTKILNWYSNNILASDSKEYTIRYLINSKFNSDLIEGLKLLDEGWFVSVGSNCRLMTNGYPFTEQQLFTINSKINTLIDRIEVKEEVVKKEKEITKRFDISEYLEFIEDRTEEFLHNEIKHFNFYEYFISNSVNFNHVKGIVDKYSTLLNYLKEALNGDEEIQEYFPKGNKLNKYILFVESIINDANKISQNAKATRKPRKTKKISSTKLVEKVKYCKENNDFKVKSINPVDIIGAKQLLIFDHQYRKIGLYYSKNEEGFTVKGTTILNIDEDNSIQKIVRKPEELLNKVLTMTKQQLKVLIKDIKTSEQKLTGRISENIILLKVFK